MQGRIQAIAATPYAWPWHGALDPARLALVVLRQERWQPPSPLPTSSLPRSPRLFAARRVWSSSRRDEARPAFAADAVVSTRRAARSTAPRSTSCCARGPHRSAPRRLGPRGPVHSTMRDANDRGYECLLVADACAALDPALVEAAFSMVMHSGGIFGAYAPARRRARRARARSRRPPPTSDPMRQGAHDDRADLRAGSTPTPTPGPTTARSTRRARR